MDLVKIWRILWRFKWLFVVALIASIFLAYWGYQQPKIFYETRLNLALEDPSFGIGRAGNLPSSVSNYERLVSLAPTYAFLLTSDGVIKKAEENIGFLDSQVSAEPVQNTAIIILRVEGNDPVRIREVATGVARAFSEYVKEKQEEKNIPPNDRIIISILGSPSPSIQLQSRKMEIAFLFFLAPLIFSFLLAAGLENIIQHKGKMKVLTEREVKNAVDKL